MSFDGHTGNVTALGFHRDGQWMFTGSEDKTIKLWDLRWWARRRRRLRAAADDGVRAPQRRDTTRRKNLIRM